MGAWNPYFNLVKDTPTKPDEEEVLIMGIVKINDKAKDFTLRDQTGKEIHLSDLKGKKVLLSFHPLAWTSVCALQMKSLEENRERREPRTI